MDNMLERLLRIKGESQQMTMEGLEEAPIPPAPPPCDELNQSAEALPGGKERHKTAQVKQLLTQEAVLALGEMYQRGEVQLLDKLVYYKSSCLMYAHFRINLD